MIRCMVHALALGAMGSWGSAQSQGGEAITGISEMSLVDLEDRKQAIEEELHGLAHDSLNSGVGPIGYRSRVYDSPNQSEWVQVGLGEETSMDEIVLVPALWRDTELGFVSDAFPEAFRIFVGSGEGKGEMVAEVKDTEDLLPRTAPLMVATPGARGSWVRVEALKLNPRAFDGGHVFQLSELLVLDGEVNRALKRPVTSSNPPLELPAWNRGCLVDGILPYVLNAAHGEQSLAMVGLLDSGGHPEIVIDLGSELEVSGIRLHAVDQSDTVPQSFSGDFGLPPQFRIDGASTKEFSEGRLLMEGVLDSIEKVGPIMAWNFPEERVRFVRLTVEEAYQFVDRPFVGFAEIEVLSKGVNVAKGCEVHVDFAIGDPARQFSSLTDGLNLYGEILPLRQWLSELSRRHDLQVQLPMVEQALTQRYAFQKRLLNWVSWTAVVLGAGIAVLILYHRILSMRQEHRIRERISANLHDELGANLHAIGLLGDLAKDVVDSREDLVDTLNRIRSLSDRTGSAARNCANMIAAKDVCEDLEAEMRRDCSRLLADLDYEIHIEGDKVLRGLKRRRRIDLYLFYKESLVNVIRHSGATHVETHLVAEPSMIRLTVTDNGVGYTGSPSESLKRRARMLGANVELETPESGGTRVVLTLRTRMFGKSS